MPTLYREFETQAEIDAQYNPSLGLADAGAPLRTFLERAQRARSELKCLLDIPYGPTVHETLDIFPADTPNAPVFVFLHGGYWRAFTSKEFSGVALGLQASGITTVVVNYALCPWVTIDEITRQVRSALAWTFRHIANYGGDPLRVAVGGHSAGGHLSAMALLSRWQEDYGLGPHPLKAALLISGLYDLAPLRHSYLQPMLQIDDGVIQRCSPLKHVRAGVTPTWITWGGAESEEFARQSHSLHAALQAAGHPSELRAIPGVNHFSVIDGFSDAQSDICRWLTQQLGAFPA